MKNENDHLPIAALVYNELSLIFSDGLACDALISLTENRLIYQLMKIVIHV